MYLWCIDNVFCMYWVCTDRKLLGMYWQEVMYFTCIASVSGMYPRCIMTVISQWTFMYYGCIGSCAPHLCLPHNMYWRCIWYVYFSVLVMYWQCNTSQYIIEVLGCITRCIVMYSLMYRDVFGEAFGFMSRRGIHLNTSGNTSQYIVEYIIIPLKYIPIHLWCIGMLIHPKNIWYIQNTSQYIPIHLLHPQRFANEKPDENVALNSGRPHRFRRAKPHRFRAPSRTS